MESKIFNSLNEVQAIQNQWEKGVVAEEERTPANRTQRMIEEVVELEEAVGNLDGTLERQLEAGFEAADVIIVALGVIDSLGFDAERLINEKMAINYRKYDHVTNGQLRANGMSHAEARTVQKQNWKKPI